MDKLEDLIKEDKKWRNYYRFVNTDNFGIVYRIKDGRMHFNVLMKTKWQHIKFHRVDIERYHCGFLWTDHLYYIRDRLLSDSLDSLDKLLRIQKLQDLVDLYCGMNEYGVKRTRQQTRICDRIGREVAQLVAFIEAYEHFTKLVPIKSHYF
jgi:hypothetical protein